MEFVEHYFCVGFRMQKWGAQTPLPNLAQILFHTPSSVITLPVAAIHRSEVKPSEATTNHLEA